MTTVQTWDEEGVVCKWKDILKNQEVFTGDTDEKGSKLGAPVGRWGWRSRPAAPEWPCMSSAPACPPTLPHLSHAGRKPAQAVGFLSQRQHQGSCQGGETGSGFGMGDLRSQAQKRGSCCMLSSPSRALGGSGCIEHL